MNNNINTTTKSKYFYSKPSQSYILSATLSKKAKASTSSSKIIHQKSKVPISYLQKNNLRKSLRSNDPKESHLRVPSNKETHNYEKSQEKSNENKNQSMDITTNSIGELTHTKEQEKINIINNSEKDKNIIHQKKTTTKENEKNTEKKETSTISDIKEKRNEKADSDMKSHIIETNVKNGENENENQVYKHLNSLIDDRINNESLSSVNVSTSKIMNPLIEENNNDYSENKNSTENNDLTIENKFEKEQIIKDEPIETSNTSSPSKNNLDNTDMIVDKKDSNNDNEDLMDIDLDLNEKGIKENKN
jgi:hypothetical protein